MGNIISQEARKRQAIVKYALKKGKSKAAAMYGVSLSSIKRWCKRYDGTWQSLKEKSHRPHHHPSQHTQAEEKMIYHSFQSKFLRWGWDGVYEDLLKQGYTRSLSGMVYVHFPVYKTIINIPVLYYWSSYKLWKKRNI